MLFESPTRRLRSDRTSSPLWWIVSQNIRSSRPCTYVVLEDLITIKMSQFFLIIAASYELSACVVAVPLINLLLQIKSDTEGSKILIELTLILFPYTSPISQPLGCIYATTEQQQAQAWDIGSSSTKNFEFLTNPYDHHGHDPPSLPLMLICRQGSVLNIY